MDMVSDEPTPEVSPDMFLTDTSFGIVIPVDLYFHYLWGDLDGGGRVKKMISIYCSLCKICSYFVVHGLIAGLCNRLR